MQRYKILWVDDEIDLLKPYVLTLKEKNFQINTFNNPYSILEYIDENNDFDLILLDENMPGKSGLTLIKDIKDRKPFVPIIMITKNEEENIMNEAIGSMISDYLIKPFEVKFEPDSQDSHLLLKISDGIAVVDGYRVSKNPSEIRVQKSRTTSISTGTNVVANFGNYVNVSSTQGNTNGLPN